MSVEVNLDAQNISPVDGVEFGHFHLSGEFIIQAAARFVNVCMYTKLRNLCELSDL
jgi:hypothetical protein